MRNIVTIQDGSSQEESRSRPENGFDLGEHIHFFQTFVRRPSSVGALSPSSPALARTMVHGLELETANTVVELGPGTGAVTGPILHRIGKNTTFLALELNSSYARRLRKRFPRLSIYNDSAERVRDYLAAHEQNKADYIISGLPWASLDSAIQTPILDSIMSALGNDGVFTTFAYLHACWMPKARRFRRRLEKHFNRVEKSPVVWGNLPPAFVYRCREPRMP